MWGADLTVAAPAESFQPVWVDLDVVFGPAPEHAAPPGGDPARLLVITGRVPGRLRGWRRAADGRWIGLVDYEICDQQGRSAVFHVRAAVPAEALSPIPPTPRR